MRTAQKQRQEQIALAREKLLQEQNQAGGAGAAGTPGGTPIEDQPDTIETVDVSGNVPGITSIPGSVPGTTIPGTQPGTSTGPNGAVINPLDPNETLPTFNGGTTMTRVSAEASAASRAKYIEGLDAFNQDDYERARAAWIVAKQLDPGNTDADLGLRKLEELMK